MKKNDHRFESNYAYPKGEADQTQKLRTAYDLIRQVLEEAPEVYWDFARANLTFPAILLRPRKPFDDQIKLFREKGVLPPAIGRPRDWDGEFNKAVVLAYSQIVEINLRLILEQGVIKTPLPELVVQIESLPVLCMDTIKQWEPVFLDILDILLESNFQLAESLEKKARGGLLGKTDSPSPAVLKAEIRAEFKKALKRFVKERDSLLPEQQGQLFRKTGCES
tara:strand:+ start:1341 stop:2006 length:666 start_codon:yes stop_codon:yes gene_type:complete